MLIYIENEERHYALVTSMFSIQVEGSGLAGCRFQRGPVLTKQVVGSRRGLGSGSCFNREPRKVDLWILFCIFN